MKFAVIEGNHVANVIVAREEQKAELEAALGTTLIDAAPLGLTIGDYFNGEYWTRNLNGEQVRLPMGDNPAVEAVLNVLRGVGDDDVD